LIQAWDFVSGSSWQHRMEEGVARASGTIAVLSNAYLPQGDRREGHEHEGP